MKKQYAIICVIALMSIFLNGCTTNKEFNDIVYVIEKQLRPAGLDKKIKFCIGPVSCYAARSMVKGIVFFSDLDDDVDDADIDDFADMVGSVRKVQIAVYELDHRARSANSLSVESINKELKYYAWERFLTFKEDDGTVCCYYRQEKNRFGGVFIIVQDNNDLVILELTGDVEKIVEKITEMGKRHS